MIKAAGLQKKVVAEMKGITPETLSRHIHGKIQLTLNDAKEYADILGCSPQQVMFKNEPIEIVVFNIIDANGASSQVNPMKDSDFPPGKVYLSDQYQENIGAIIYIVHEEYQGPWMQYRDAIGIVLMDPIQTNTVSKDSIQQRSLVKIQDGPVLFGYVYPEPRNRYSVYNPWADSEINTQASFLENDADKLDQLNGKALVSGQKLQWATPIVSVVWRPDLKSISVCYKID